MSSSAPLLLPRASEFPCSSIDVDRSLLLFRLNTFFTVCSFDAASAMSDEFKLSVLSLYITERQPGGVMARACKGS